MALQPQPVKTIKHDSQQQKEDEQAKVEDHIHRRFELMEFKGKGAYGIVWKAIDKKTQQTVALKKIFDAFHNATDSQRTFREVIFLEQLTEHENIVKLLNVVRADNDRDLYMVFEFMETDLHKVIRAGILEGIHKKYVVYQCLKALKYLHSAELVHRDLKPSNLLINSQCKIKVADFGLARSLLVSNEECSPVMTEYVATRWYRAPEILLGSQNYSKAVDMWSIGCIVGEMVVGKAIFAGTSTLNQIERIIELIGRPKSEDLEYIQAPLASSIFLNITAQKKKSFAQFFSGGSDEVIDFIRACLIYNPAKRMTVEQGLIHPYLKEFLGTEPETVKDKKIQTFLNDNQKFTVKEYRQELYNHLASQKRQIHKQLVIRVHKTIDKQQQPPSVSPQKTESKQIQKQMTKEITENNETVKRPMDEVIDNDVSKQRKILHYKSQSYVPIQYQSISAQKEMFMSSQGSVIQDSLSMSQSPVNKKKLNDSKLVTKLITLTGEARTESSQFLPQMEPSPNKPLSRATQNDKRLLSSETFGQLIHQPQLLQQMQSTQSNYFFNGSPQQILRKNSITKIVTKQKSFQTSQQSTPVHQISKQHVNKELVNKTIGEQYRQYMSLKSQMGTTSYDNIFKTKVKQRK